MLWGCFLFLSFSLKQLHFIRFLCVLVDCRFMERSQILRWTCLIEKRYSLKQFYALWCWNFPDWRLWWNMLPPWMLLILLNLAMKVIFSTWSTFLNFSLLVSWKNFIDLPFSNANLTFLSSFKGFVAATVTPQHLVLNRNSLFQGGLQPHNFCLPVLKREIHSNILYPFLLMLRFFLLSFGVLSFGVEEQSWSNITFKLTN